MTVAEIRASIGRRAVTALLLAVVLLAGCSSGPDTPRAQPRPERPVVELSFRMAEDLSRATGRERVVFTPDRGVCELVFRAWPNRPTIARRGGALVVTESLVDGVAVNPVVVAAGAPENAPGTLIELPLPRCIDPGQTVTATLGFELTLGKDTDDRVGYSSDPEMAWFATGFPLLAWVHGAGWARDDAVSMGGETVTSEEFTLAALGVTAPSRYRVLGTGSAAGAEPGAAGTTTHRFTAEAVRDVAVSVGGFDVLERERRGLRLHLATPRSGTKVEPEQWADQFGESVDALTRLLGPFPYPDLWVTVIPAQSDGLEFPTALQFGDVGRKRLEELVAHEVAHQWLYSLVGNNQARDPWIDEAFTTFAEAVATHRENVFEFADIPDGRIGNVGRPMAYWDDNGGFDRYNQVVYLQGAAVLLEARRQVGAKRFDAALREYVQTNAHRVVGKREVAHAFRDLPEVLELLRKCGALADPAVADR